MNLQCRSCKAGDLDCDGIVDDADQDGIDDKKDKCPKTPKGEAVDATGCGASQKDTDQDGLPDEWETLYGLNPLTDDAYDDFDHDGLTNLEEYLQGTDPTRADTDGDGWSDYDEYIRGTDPKDASSHPSSNGVLIFLIVATTAIGAGVGYYIYRKKNGLGLPAFRNPFSKKMSSPFGVLSRSSPFVRKELPRVATPAPIRPTTVVKEEKTSVIPDDWMTLDKLRPKTDKPKDAFEKLKSFRQPDAPSQVKEVKVSKNPFDSLSSLAKKSPAVQPAKKEEINPLQKLKNTLKPEISKTEPKTSQETEVSSKLSALAKKAKVKKE